MTSPALLLTVFLLSAAAPVRAEPAADETPARVKESLERLEAALAPMRKDAYLGRDRRGAGEILTELRERVAKLPKTPNRAADLAALEKGAADLVRGEETFWSAVSPRRPATVPFSAGTADALLKGAAALGADFAKLYPDIGPAFSPAFTSASFAAGTSAQKSEEQARAVRSGRAAATDARLFYDGGAQKNGDPASSAGAEFTGSAQDRYVARGGVFTARPTKASDLTLGPVPAPQDVSAGETVRPAGTTLAKPAKSALLAAAGDVPVTGPLAAAVAGPEFKDALNAPKPRMSAPESACREASDGGVIAGLCGSKVTAWSAPMAAGVLDAFKEQFGTVGGLVSLFAFTALGVLMSILSGGVGLLVTVIKALCGVAILWAAGSMISRLWDAFKEFGSTTADDPRHWRALRAMGKVGGELLIMVMMAFAGYKLGQTSMAKGAMAKMTEALQGQMGKLGIRPAPAPELKAAMGAADESAAGAGANALAADAFEVAPSKWDYFFGRVKAKITKDMSKTSIDKQLHNERRSAQIARVLKDNGIEDNPEGRSRLMALFRKAWSSPKMKDVVTEFGEAEIKACELPSATLEISFFKSKGAPSVEVTTIIPKEHPPGQ